jgi:flagellar biosynthetic protein FliR
MAAAFQAFAMLTFLAIDGHQALLLAAGESFQLLPLGAGAPSGDAFLAIANAGSVIFATAARLALPVTVAMLVANAGLGLVGRAIPQLNLMTIQLPAHVAMLLLLVAFGARELTDSMASILVPWMESLSPMVAGGP